MNRNTTLLAGAILGGLGVALGAFGAHALKTMLLQSGRLDTFELAVKYQFYHAFALLVNGVIQQFMNAKAIRTSAVFFLSGIILFSGSLYLVCLTNNTVFAMVTPLGGVLLIVGWLFLAIGIFKSK